MLLDNNSSQKLLRKYSIDFPSSKKFPMVLKVDSPDVIHKTELGLVFLNINSKKELESKKKEAIIILKKNKIKKYSLIEQEMINGTEIIIGIKRDSVFGPAIVFGLGGVFVELLKDVSMRLAPLTRKDCETMIEEIKGKKLLEGFRGKKPVNKKLIVDLLMKASKMAMNEKKINEADFNPVIITDKKAYVADARIIC